MAMAGLYRRVLPSPPAIDFASSEGKVSSFLLLLLAPVVIEISFLFFHFYFVVDLGFGCGNFVAGRMKLWNKYVNVLLFFV